MSRYKITIEYDGSNFCGWQRQKDCISIQESIEKAISNFCQEDVEVVAAGRTDAKVHAYAMVAHFDLEKEKEPYVIQNALNFYLRPVNIAIIKAEKVPNDFHARFSAVKRSYIYKILNRYSPPVLDKNRVWHIVEDLDVGAMNQAAQYLIGQHDYSSFRASACQAKSPIRSIDKAELYREGDYVIFKIEALSFLHHQVRNIIGTLRDVGTHKISVEDFKVILDKKDRTIAGITAPAEGLYFNQATYSI